jgi:hypothetical protein
MSADLTLLRERHSPNSVTDVVSHEEGPVRVQCDANGSTHGVAVCGQKAAQEILRYASRFSIDKWHEHHLVTGTRFTVP